MIFNVITEIAEICDTLKQAFSSIIISFFRCFITDSIWVEQYEKMQNLSI